MSVFLKLIEGFEGAKPLSDEEMEIIRQLRKEIVETSKKSPTKALENLLYLSFRAPLIIGWEELQYTKLFQDILRRMQGEVYRPTKTDTTKDADLLKRERIKKGGYRSGLKEALKNLIRDIGDDQAFTMDAKERPTRNIIIRVVQGWLLKWAECGIAEFSRYFAARRAFRTGRYLLPTFFEELGVCYDRGTQNFCSEKDEYLFEALYWLYVGVQRAVITADDKKDIFKIMVAEDNPDKSQSESAYKIAPDIYKKMESIVGQFFDTYS